MKFKIFLLFITSILFTTNFSLPRFAIKSNSKCIDCHFNPTGGIIRNERGFNYGKNRLAMFSSKENSNVNQLMDNFSFGLDYRTQFLAYFDSTKSRGDFQDMTGSIYTNIVLSDEIYIVSRFDFLKSIFEGYGVLNILPNESYIKAGSFAPSFGIRLDDHTAYTRGGDFGLITNSKSNNRGLIFNPYQIHTGVEFGFNLPNDFGLLTFSSAKRQGSPFQNEPCYVARLEITPDLSTNFNIMFGGSYMKYSEMQAGNEINKKLYGGFFGFGFSNFSLLTEYDIGKNYFKQDTTSTAIMIEASYEFMNGLNFLFRYDSFDPNNSTDKDEIAHLIFGFEIFPYSFIEIRPQYRVAIENPEVKNNSFVLQFHFFY